ncbi:hypothetical protein DSO57_1032668 [Entomophthora muscae]|uniref:Uncharacterized protein n=1 Tax=Entomophthora muscae TaxID=34485 RepID=A0ACC2RRC0_9FUNG|nr:hypothetical protein DSO57_1032668 [Entomophthora muscae]
MKSSHFTTGTSTNIPPNCPKVSSEDDVAFPVVANYSLSIAELFFPEKYYTDNALHWILANAVHAVQAQSQTKADNKAQGIIAKPYAQQLLDNAPGKKSSPSTYGPHLK